MNNNKVVEYAKKTFLAMKNPLSSVDHVYANAIDVFNEDNDYVCYVGVKNRFQVPEKLLETLRSKEKYCLHTLDHASAGGRAVDISIINPITGRAMTGSSSGTAVNVLLGINDLGIGVDGGGSVLAPAMSCQLFGFISNLIEKEFVDQFSSKSTDNITFSPSIGFMTRDFYTMKKAIKDSLSIEEEEGSFNILLPEDGTRFMGKNIYRKVRENIPQKHRIETCIYPDLSGERNALIKFLSNSIKEHDIVLSYEGPIDVLGFGDTVFGHFDEMTKTIQSKSGKGLIRVANMADATSLSIPSRELGCAYVFFCESKPEKIRKLLELAKSFVCDQDELLQRYFQKFESYFPKEFRWNKNINA